MPFLYFRKGIGEYSFEESKVLFFGIPFEYSQIHSFGTKFFPNLIRESIASLEDEKGLINRAKLCDLGDLEIVPGSFELTSERIEDSIKIIKERKKKFIAVGGEHLITLPIVKTLKPKTIIQFDAHMDLRKEYLGNKFTSGTWAYYAGKDVKIIQIGIRSWSAEEKRNAEELGVIQVSSLKGLKIEEPLYVTIDMDVFDLSLAKEVSIPEPGKGFDLEKIKEELSYLKGREVIGADICECNAVSFLNVTPFLAGKVFFYLLEIMLE